MSYTHVVSTKMYQRFLRQWDTFIKTHQNVVRAKSKTELSTHGMYSTMKKKNCLEIPKENTLKS